MFRMLWVEDDDRTRELIAEYMAKHLPEVAVTFAHDYRSAVQHVESGAAFDLIVSDFHYTGALDKTVNPKGVGGLDLYEFVGSYFPNTYFIYYSGKAEIIPDLFKARFVPEEFPPDEFSLPPILRKGTDMHDLFSRIAALAATPSAPDAKPPAPSGQNHGCGDS